MKPLKLESSSTGGTETDLFPTESNPAEDYGSFKGISFENSDSNLLDVQSSILTSTLNFQFTANHGSTRSVGITGASSSSTAPANLIIQSSPSNTYENVGIHTSTQSGNLILKTLTPTDPGGAPGVAGNSGNIYISTGSAPVGDLQPGVTGSINITTGDGDFGTAFAGGGVGGISIKGGLGSWLSTIGDLVLAAPGVLAGGGLADAGNVYIYNGYNEIDDFDQGAVFLQTTEAGDTYKGPVIVGYTASQDSAYKVQVNGAGYFSTSAGTANSDLLMLNNSGSGNGTAASLRFKLGGTVYGHVKQRYQSGAYLDFASTSAATHMTIDPNGLVGVGIATPDSNLHVHKATAGVVSASANSIATFENSTSGYVTILTPNANESGVLFGNVTSNVAGGVIYNNTATANGLQFRTNGNSTKMIIDSAGNVAIGTTTASNKFHVQGAGRFNLDHYNADNFYIHDLNLSGTDMMRIESEGPGGFEALGVILFDPDGQGYRMGLGNADPQEVYHQTTGNWLFGRSSTNEIQMRFFNSSNTSGAHVRSQLSTAGTSAGDPFHHYVVTGATDFSTGIDNSDSDKWGVWRASAPGTSAVMTVDSTRKVTFDTGIVSTTYVQIPHDTSGVGPSMTVNGQIACGSATGSDSMYFRANGTSYFINASGSY